MLCLIWHFGEYLEGILGGLGGVVKYVWIVFRLNLEACVGDF